MPNSSSNKDTTMMHQVHTSVKYTNERNTEEYAVSINKRTVMMAWNANQRDAQCPLLQ